MLVRGAGDRGLCAGGDIVAIYRDMLDGGDATADFWAVEYRLNLLISEYPKPYVAFMDGLVLGGGVGISAHGSVRIVTERTRTGMPETTIGFVPDVGGTLLLSGSPGETGTHAALTGAHLSGADALFLGLADCFVPSAGLAELAVALETEAAEAAVARFAEPAPQSVLAAQQEWIDACYSSDDAEEILRRLRTVGGEAAGAADTIEAKSPTAVKVALESLRRVRGLSLEQALGAGVPRRPALPRRPGLPRRHPRPGGGQGPQSPLEARHPRGGHPGGRRGLLRPAGRARTEALSEGEEQGEEQCLKQEPLLPAPSPSWAWATWAARWPSTWSRPATG